MGLLTRREALALSAAVAAVPHLPKAAVLIPEVEIVWIGSGLPDGGFEPAGAVAYFPDGESASLDLQAARRLAARLGRKGY